MATVEPHPIDVPQSDLDDLRERLRRTRWPERETVDDWSQGIPLAYVQDVCRTWAEDYDWRRVEAELNGYEQLRYLDEGGPEPLGFQVLHAPLARARRRARWCSPTAGRARWSSSSTSSSRSATRGGTAAIRPTPSTSCARRCPATGSATSRPWPAGTSRRVADAWARLMTALGYERFGAQGGDWGSAVTTGIGAAASGPVRRASTSTW